MQSICEEVSSKAANNLHRTRICAGRKMAANAWPTESQLGAKERERERERGERTLGRDRQSVKEEHYGKKPEGETRFVAAAWMELMK